MLIKILLLIFDYYYYYYCYYVHSLQTQAGLVCSPWERTTSHHFEKVVCATYERWWFKREFNYILGSLSNYDGDGYENVT